MKTTITVGEDSTTVKHLGAVIELPVGGKMSFNSCCCTSQEEPAPFECPSQPQWLRGEETKFGFIPVMVDDVVQFVSDNDVGDATTLLPAGTVAFLNQGTGILVSINPATPDIGSMTVTITSNEEGEDPLVIEAELDDGYIQGASADTWQLQEDKTYCVSVLPHYTVE
jgi:hypothetical protein